MAKVNRKADLVCADKPNYRITNWKTYNEGLVKRGSLTLWIEEGIENTWHYDGPVKRGGQQAYSDSCILMLLTVRVVFRLAFRQTEGFARSIFELMKISLKIPSYTQICRRQSGLKVPPNISQRLKNGENIYVVVDSSGLKVYGEGEWKVKKHGVSKRRTWRKIHLGVDEKSGEIIAQVLTENDVDDAAVVPQILRQATENGVKIDRFAGDGGYDKRKCYDILDENDIQPIIPPQLNADYWERPDGEIDPDHPRNLALLEIDEGGPNENRKQWKINSGYHRRSLSETTFFRWKTILGGKLAARKFENQQTEAAIKSAVLNRFIQTAKPVSVKAA